MEEINIEALALEVHSELGSGYTERIYQNAMEVLLRERNISYESERIIPVMFKGHVIGNCRADIIIEKKIVVEMKAIKNLTESATLQIQKYLHMTGLHTGFLINFPPPGHDRKIELKKIYRTY